MTVDEALNLAAKEHSLQDYYIDTVRPLLKMKKEELPICCSGGCEPCYATLVQVADRALKLLNVEILP